MSAFLGSVAGQTDKIDFKQVFTAFAIAIFLGAWTANIAAGLALFIFANAFLHVIQTKTQQMLGL
jgi:membrane protein insertase Oxa1/YidC/SpoIIIJ